MRSRRSLSPPARSGNKFVNLEKYFKKYHRDENQRCKSDNLTILFPRRVGHTDKERTGTHKLKKKGNMFLSEEVRKVVSQNPTLVTDILECDCRICTRMRSLQDGSCIGVEQISRDNPETSSNGSIASNASSGTSSSFSPSSMPMSVIFAMLVYLRLPFMIHLGLWSHPDGLSSDQLLIMTREAGSSTYLCFQNLIQLRKAWGNDSDPRWQRAIPLVDIELEARDFYDAFQQAKSQFHAVFISTDMGTLDHNAVLPYEKYEQIDRGGQGSIYYVKVPLAMDKTGSGTNDSLHVILHLYPLWFY